MRCEDLQESEFSECDRRTSIVCKQKGKKYELKNDCGELVCKVKVDRGIIQDGEKCDYLVLICGKNITVFVELKGNHVDKACSQVLSTIEYFERDLRNSNSIVYVRVVAQSVPKVEGSNEKKLKRKLKFLNNGKFIRKKELDKKSISYSERMSELI